MAKGVKEYQSKGAEEMDNSEDQAKKPILTMVEFEDSAFNVRDLSRMKRTIESSSRFPSGVDAKLTIMLFSHPFEEIFHYETIEARERAYELLKMKLADLRVLIETANPLSEFSEQEDAEPEDDEPAQEGIYDGLEDLLEK